VSLPARRALVKSVAASRDLAQRKRLRFVDDRHDEAIL
jgi:hypothetical protein